MDGQEEQLGTTQPVVDLDRSRNSDIEMNGGSDEEDIAECEETASSQAKTAKTKRAGQKKTQKEDNNCLACNKRCTGSQASVLCQLCSLWCHKDCAGMSNAVFKSLALQVKEVGMAYWACKSCLNFAAKTNALLKNMNTQILNMDAEIKKNAEDISIQRKEMGKMDSGLKRVEKKVEDVRKQVEEDMIEELRERETRKLNLIIHGVEEPEKARDNRERMEMDMDSCSKIFDTMEARVKRDQMKFCRRLGEKGREPRPIIIGLTSEDGRRQILEKSRRLRGTRYENVHVVADLTRRQRQGEQRMVDEAEKRNRNLTEEERAKNLKWMVVGRKGEKRMIKGEDRGLDGRQRERQETGTRRKEGGTWDRHTGGYQRHGRMSPGGGREREWDREMRGNGGGERETERGRSKEQERLIAQLEAEQRKNRRLTAQLEENVRDRRNSKRGRGAETDSESETTEPRTKNTRQ